jgi:hypothetical protein
MVGPPTLRGLFPRGLVLVSPRNGGSGHRIPNKEIGASLSHFSVTSKQLYCEEYLMKKLFNGLLLMAASAIACTAHAEALNLSYAAGHYGSDCAQGPQGASVVRSSMTPCQIETTLPVPAGKTIKQVTVYHGTLFAGSDISAQLRYKEFKSGDDSANPGGTDIATWWSDTDVLYTDMASKNLLTQTGVPPLVSYPDAFVVASDRTYTVRVTLDQQSEYFGLRVLYQ